jgi:hypothetical protein
MIGSKLGYQVEHGLTPVKDAARNLNEEVFSVTYTVEGVGIIDDILIPRKYTSRRSERKTKLAPIA